MHGRAGIRRLVAGTTSWPPQEKVFIWPPFFEYNNKRLLRDINWPVFENAAKKNVYLTVFSWIGQGAGPQADIR